MVAVTVCSDFGAQKIKSVTVSRRVKERKKKVVASGPIISWQINWGKVETMTEFFLGSKITEDSDCTKRRGSLRCLPPLEVRPSSVA